MKKIFFAFFGLLALAGCQPTPQENPQQGGETASVDQVIMARRSIRQYTSQQIDSATLTQILKCGINAPNGRALQAYEIRVVNNPELLKGITKAVLNDTPEMQLKPGADNIFFGAKTVVFLACDRGYDMSQVDCGLLGENIILSAWDKGIGSCCLAHPVRLMKESPSCAPFIEKLDFGKNYELLYCIALGYPNESPEAKPRREDMIKFL